MVAEDQLAEAKDLISGLRFAHSQTMLPRAGGEGADGD